DFRWHAYLLPQRYVHWQFLLAKWRLWYRPRRWLADSGRILKAHRFFQWDVSEQPVRWQWTRACPFHLLEFLGLRRSRRPSVVQISELLDLSNHRYGRRTGGL